jgi:exopolysaccharide production protein ExoZ
MERWLSSLANTFARITHSGDTTALAMTNLYSTPKSKVTAEVITIQYLRGAAAAIVVISHLTSTYGLEYLYQPRLGDFGVDIFFVISGFIMWHTTVEADMTTIEFWQRRISRIVPQYWIFLTLLVIISFSIPQSLHSTFITPENTIKSFLFIPHYNISIHMVAPILIPGWSLNYEMFFYFVFGLSLFIQSRQSRYVAILVTLVTLVSIGWILQPTNAIALTYTNYALVKFIAGILLAIAYRAGTLNNPVLGLGFILALPISIFVYATGRSILTNFVDFFALSPTLIVGGALALESIARAKPSTILGEIGNASYSIYLSHLFFLRLLEEGWRRLAGLGASATMDATYILAGLVFAVVGGVAVYHLVERPLLLLLRKRRKPLVNSKVIEPAQAGPGFPHG